MSEQVNQRKLDRLFDTLRHPYRRRILLLLSEQSSRGQDEFHVEELQTVDDEINRLTIELYHNHLPKLADAGYIEWDESTDIICRGDKFDEIGSLLELMEDHKEELPKGWP